MRDEALQAERNHNADLVVENKQLKQDMGEIVSRLKEVGIACIAKWDGGDHVVQVENVGIVGHSYTRNEARMIVEWFNAFLVKTQATHYADLTPKVEFMKLSDIEALNPEHTEGIWR